MEIMNYRSTCAVIALTTSTLLAACGSSEAAPEELPFAESAAETTTTEAPATTTTADVYDVDEAPQVLHDCADAMEAALADLDPTDASYNADVKAALDAGEADIGPLCVPLSDPESVGLTEDDVITFMTARFDLQFLLALLEAGANFTS